PETPVPPPMDARAGNYTDPRIRDIEMSSPLPPPTRPVRRMMQSSLDEEAMVDAMRTSQAEPSEVYGPPRRRKVGGWIVALVLLAGAGVVGVLVVKPYLSKPAASSQQALDPRAQQLLNDGEKALADGNLDAAKENFDKASVIAEKDPRVLLDLARV